MSRELEAQMPLCRTRHRHHRHPPPPGHLLAFGRGGPVWLSWIWPGVPKDLIMDADAPPVCLSSVSWELLSIQGHVPSKREVWRDYLIMGYLQLEVSLLLPSCSESARSHPQQFKPHQNFSFACFYGPLGDGEQRFSRLRYRGARRTFRPHFDTM